MGSLGAMSSRGKKSYSKDRYFQAEVSSDDKIVPEGIEGQVAYRGPLSAVAHQLVGGLNQSMFYVGARTIPELQEKGQVRADHLGLAQGEPPARRADDGRGAQLHRTLIRLPAEGNLGEVAHRQRRVPATHVEHVVLGVVQQVPHEPLDRHRLRVGRRASTSARCAVVSAGTDVGAPLAGTRPGRPVAREARRLRCVHANSRSAPATSTQWSTYSRADQVSGAGRRPASGWSSSRSGRRTPRPVAPPRPSPPVSSRASKPHSSHSSAMPAVDVVPGVGHGATLGATAAGSAIARLRR